MHNKLTFDSTIYLSGKFRGKTVKEVLENNKHDIFELIKAGVQFSDEVLKEANISKTIRNRSAKWEFEKHVDKSKKVYAKETASIKEILKSFDMTENDYFEEEPTDDNDIYNENTIEDEQ